MATLALVQGYYFLFAGIWVLLRSEYFPFITGRLTGSRLPRCLGILAVAVGAGLILAGAREQFDGAIMLMAIASASGLMGIDLVHVLKGGISPIYAADAAVQFGLLLGWMGCVVAI